MKTTFVLQTPIIYPKTLPEFKSSSGFVISRVLIVECTTKKWINQSVVFKGTLSSIAPYFAHTGYLKVDPEGNFVVNTPNTLLTSTLRDPEYITVEGLRFLAQEIALAPPALPALPSEGREGRMSVKDELAAYINSQTGSKIHIGALKTQSFMRQEILDLCDLFRLEKESSIVDLYGLKANKMTPFLMKLRVLPSDKLNALMGLAGTTPWLLCLQKWSKEIYGIKRLTFKSLSEWCMRRKQTLPTNIYCAIKAYDRICYIRKNQGHTLFSLPSLQIENEELRTVVIDFLRYKAIRFVDPECTMFCILEDFRYATEIITWIRQLYLSQAPQGPEKDEEDTPVHPPSIRRPSHPHFVGAGRAGDGPLVRSGRFRPCLPSGTLTTEQRAFIAHVKNPLTKCAFLNGGPGTGKSETGLVWLLSHFSAPLIVTYTGMMVDAGQARLGGYNGVMHTMHYIIAISKHVAHGAKWLAAFDLIVFDEGSNIDTKLLSQVLACVPNACKLVMIGDYGQIYPISPGCPFKDLSEYFASSSFSLTENKRVNANSRALADASKLIATGDITQIDFDGPALSIVDRSDEALYEFLDKYCTCIGDIMKIQFVALRNADRKMLNEKIEQWLLRKKMLFKSKRVKLTAGGAHMLYAKSKITFKKNTNPSIGSSVRNGELAQVISSAPMVKGPQQAGQQMGIGYMLTLQNGKTILVNSTGDDGVNYRDIEAGYASTCNKSQGSEWDVILFYMYEGCQDLSVWSRSYPYVAVSRAKLHCTIMGTRQELETIVRRVQPERHTVLRYLLGKSGVNINYAVIDIEEEKEEDTPELELMDPDVAPVPRLKDYAEKKSKKIKV